MHTCQIIVRDYGFNPEDLCGEPATKSVIHFVKASGEPCDWDEIIWMCDEHYAHAVATWSRCAF